MTDISITVTIAALLLLVEHWFPWRLILRRDLPRLAAYVLGVLALVLPLSGLYWAWASSPPGSSWAWLVALWAVIIGGGLSVGLAYLIDWCLQQAAQARDLAELMTLREGDAHEGENIE
jgi:hypothetical protein